FQHVCLVFCTVFLSHLQHPFCSSLYHLGCAVLLYHSKQAINLGVDYDHCIRRLLLGVTLCIAVATAMVGPISFLGLIIANLSRQLLKTFRHTQLVLGSALFGMIVLVGGQLIVERVYTYSIPVSVFITVGGGVYFLYLLLTRKKV
ncbi:iron chelate uptake ABC transporter family permease subunit, partial [Agathobaculum sp. LCP25S3_E8]|uniref:iron chelate uptake ABC transporter family permease subunit n=1 Tax=Agathobaculum sp. LCP25S3_E8 TaxID=3438735 RepID=UPI003F92C413